MENLASLLRAKPVASEGIAGMGIQNNINTNMPPNINLPSSMNNFGCLSGGSSSATSSSCIKCQEIYNMLNDHILESHRNELGGNEKDSSSILNNVLTSILMLLTTANKTDAQSTSEDSFQPSLEGTSLANATPTFSLAASSSVTNAKTPPEVTEPQSLNPLVPQNASLNLQTHLKAVPRESNSNLTQIEADKEGRKTVLQGIPLLDPTVVHTQGNIPLVLTHQLQPDGTRRPTMIPVSTFPKTSEKSDLDVADILVNKMPIPSVNKEESSLAQLYLKQLAEGLATGRPDILRHTDLSNQSNTNDLDLLAALLNFNNSTGCSIATVPTSEAASNKPVVETISQIVAAQKQLTSLLSLLGRRQADQPLLPVAGLASQLVETPLNNPLFANQHQKLAQPGMLQIPLSSLLPALAPSTQGFIPANLVQQTASGHAENSAVTLSNILSRTPHQFQAVSAGGAITLPALALNSSIFQNSAVPILQQTIQGSLRGSGQQTVLMPSVIPGSIATPLSLTRTLFSTPQATQSFLVPARTASRSARSSTEPKTLYATFPQSSAPSLTEQLFQNSSSIPKLALSAMPSIFNLGNIPGISVLNAGLQSQQQSSLQGAVSIRPLTLTPSTSVIVSSGNQSLASAVDKIQGLLSAAIQDPRKSTSTASLSAPKMQKEEASSSMKRRLSSLSSSLQKMDTDQSTELAEPAKLFECSTCKTTFSVLSTLQQHEQVHLGTKMQCNYCNDVFTDAAMYQKHISLHRGQENVHHCEYCSKLFTSRGELQKHLAEHTQKRPYRCTHCDKSFRDPGSLQKHERIHTGERPYKCKDCPRAFAEYSSLRKHNRVHTGEKPYACPQCPKAFSISGNLQRHLYIHTGERPYRCTKCPKAFNNPSHLRRHVKNLHDGKTGFSSKSARSDEELEMAPLET